MVKKHKASPVTFSKKKELIYDYYTEPENIKKSKVQSEMEKRCANGDLEEFDPAGDVEASQQTNAEVLVLEDVMCMN